MTTHCASCKNAELFQTDSICQRCYNSMYSKLESLKSDIVLLKHLHEQDQLVIKQKNLEIAELRQVPLFPAGNI